MLILDCVVDCESFEVLVLLSCLTLETGLGLEALLTLYSFFFTGDLNCLFSCSAIVCWLLLPSTPPLKMLSLILLSPDTTHLLCVLLRPFTGLIEGLDQLQLLKATHTSIEASSKA